MQQRLRTLFFLFFTITLSAGYGQIYSYTSDTGGVYNAIAANTTATGLSRVNGTTRPGSICGSGYSVASYSTTTTFANSLGAIEATVTPSAGYQLLVSGFTVDLRRSGSGPAYAKLAYSTDGGANWINKATIDTPRSASCGTTNTATWTTSFTVAAGSSLKFRVYGYNAALTSGTMQVLNLSILGTANSTANSLTTSAASFGPYCQGTAQTISVPFTSTGTFTGQYYVQLSDASGVFPADAVTNLISTGTTTSPASASIPAGTAAGTGYRVRVVNTNPIYFSSGDNGSNILINPTQATTVYDTLCPGGSITFNGNTQTTTGVYVAHFSTVNSCDSAVTLNLYVRTLVRDTTPAAICQGQTYTHNGQSYTTATVINDTLSCAHISSIKLTVNPTAATALYDTLCPGGSITFGGNAHTTTGVYLAHFSTVNSCDSAVTLNLYVRTLVRDTAPAAICQGETFTHNGQSYTAATVINDTLSCSHISSIKLTVNPTQATSLFDTLCSGGSITFDGTPRTATGVYVGHFSTVNGCDSAVTLNLYVRTMVRDTTPATICQGQTYTHNGQSYTTATVINDTLTCSNISSIKLTVNPTAASALYDTLCPGGSITFNGNVQTTTGAYTAHFSTVNSCDSTVTLNLYVRTLSRDTVTNNICQGDVVTHNGQTYITDTLISDTLSCAHISSFHIIVHAKPNAVATLTGNTQLSTTTFATYQWLKGGVAVSGATSQNYTAIQNGNYSVVVTDANGCSDTSNAVTVTIIGINEANTTATSIYPNPTDAIIYIDAEDMNTVQIVDMLGRTMMSSNINKGTTHTQIDISGYTNGIYTLIMRKSDNSTVIRTITKK